MIDDEEFDKYLEYLTDDGIPCPRCGGSGLEWEGWDCEYCDGAGVCEI